MLTSLVGALADKCAKKLWDYTNGNLGACTYFGKRPKHLYRCRDTAIAVYLRCICLLYFLSLTPTGAGWGTNRTAKVERQTMALA
jgi:hypothetical protein